MSNVTVLPPATRSVVSRVSVQVSEYSAENGGADEGIIYAVEVLFPDGTWNLVSHHADLADAWMEAGYEAHRRGALLLPESMWPSRQVTKGGAA